MPITDAAEWLRRSRAARDGWWTLPPEQFRLAIWLLSVSKVQDGSLRFSCLLDDVARHMACTRAKLRRALDALERVGFCDLFGQRGRGGLTMIVIKSSGSVIGHLQPRVIASEHDEFSRDRDHPPDPVGPHPTGHLKSPQAGHLQVPEISFLSDRARPESSLISDPDPKSEDPEILSNTEELNLQEPAIWVRFEATEDAATQPAPTASVNIQNRASVNIQERAWLAADYLRGRVLDEDRSALVGSAPWSATDKSGTRLAWASEFRSLHGRVLRSMRNETPGTTEGAAWDLIAKTVHWLFHSQAPGAPRFEVESPRSLAKKWDSIQRMRRRQAAPQTARGADHRPDPQASKEYEKW